MPVDWVFFNSLGYISISVTKFGTSGTHRIHSLTALAGLYLRARRGTGQSLSLEEDVGHKLYSVLYFTPGTQNGEGLP